MFLTIVYMKCELLVMVRTAKIGLQMIDLHRKLVVSLTVKGAVTVLYNNLYKHKIFTVLL